MFGARSAYTWTGATWAQTGGRAYNTPTLGSEILTNPDFESGITSWSVFGAGTLSSDATIAQNGASSARLTMDGSGSSGGIRQSHATTVGAWYSGRLYVRGNTLAANAWYLSWAGDLYATSYSNGSWISLPFTVRAAATLAFLNGYVYPTSASNAGAIWNMDNASVKNLTIATLPATVVGSAADLTVTAKPYAVTTGTQAGVISHLDSAVSLANFIIAYHDRTTVKLDKCVAGTYTNLISVTVAFTQDAVIEIRRPSGNTFQLWYGGTQRGTDQTVSDAGIISNTLYGLFSTYSANQFSEFTLGGVAIPFGF